MDLVLVDRPQPHTAVVTLNRPDRLNAMSIDLVIELHDALEEVAADNDTWVVVLTGSGRGFCSGSRPQGLRRHPEHRRPVGRAASPSARCATTPGWSR